MDILLPLKNDEAQELLELLNEQIEGFKKESPIDPFRIAKVVNMFNALDKKIKNPDFAFPPAKPEVIHGAPQDNSAALTKPVEAPTAVEAAVNTQEALRDKEPEKQVVVDDNVTAENIDLLANQMIEEESHEEPIVTSVTTTK